MIEVGDKVTGKVSGDGYTVRGAYDGKLWCERDNNSLSSQPFVTLLESQVTKVEPFFEPGKKYRCTGDYFYPERIDHNSDGSRVAYGKVVTPDRSHWTIKGESVFYLWRRFDS